MIFGPAGILYGAASAGGTLDGGIVFDLSPQ